MLGIMHTVKCHKEGITLIIDSWSRVPFNYVTGAFSNGDATVIKDDYVGSTDDSYSVKTLYEEGGEPDQSTQTRFDILTIAFFAIGAQLPDDMSGLSKVA